MPWDSFRKKRLSASSPISKKKEQPRKQTDQNQHSTSSVAPTSPIANNKETRNHHPPALSKPDTAHGIAEGLPQEVYQKIKEVEQEPSTLTVAGVEGLSARIQETQEHTQQCPDGVSRTFVCRTIEIIKRPGQSLGLYLREGNGVDRPDGVFVSRLADGFDLQKSGVLNAGEEILTLNDVDVTKMSIDEVVVMISIPKRLVLRTRSMKGMKCVMSNSPSDAPSTSMDSNSATSKPVAVIKQIVREESRESSLTDDGTPLISSQLIATAQTSLGLKARQQEAAATSAGNCATLPNQSSMTPNHRPIQDASISTHRLVSPPSFTPQLSFPDRWSYNRQLAMHTPKLLDSEGRLLRDGIEESTESNTNVNWRSRGMNGRSNDTNCQSFSAFPGAGMEGSVQVVPKPAESVPQRSMSGYGVPNIITPRSALRQHSSAIGTPSSTGSLHSATTFSNIKANSLPRRQPGRSIKWRAELPTTGDDAGAGSATNSTACYFSDVSDSDGAVSAPEFPMTPTNRNLPQPVYPLPRHPSRGKTVDEIFSRAEYQAWARSVGQKDIGQFRMGKYTPHETNDIYGWASTGLQTHWPAQLRHLSTKAMSDNEAASDDQSYQNRILNRYRTGNGPVPNWNQNRQILDDSESSSTSTPCSSARPMPPPRNSRLAKTRSSSLPPKGILNRSILKTTGNGVNGMNGDGIEERSVNGGNGIGIGRELDVSPLPHRRLPLALANAAHGLRYNGGTLLNGPNGSATLTGILTIRIMEGCALESRDGEELYCVLEVEGEHRARTEVSDWRLGFKWRETFEMDVWECRQTDFYIYSWHPQFRHKLKYQASVQLIETLLNMRSFDLNDDTSPSPPLRPQSALNLTLNLNPHGQLFIQLRFRPMPSVYRRTLATRRSAYFGTPLQTLLERETNCVGGANIIQVPVLLQRLIEEIERRGVDTSGLYLLCGSTEKRQILKDASTRDPWTADVSADTVPDINILTSVLKDFLRELPEPLIPHSIFQLLLEAWKTCGTSEKAGNAKLILGVIDCLPKVNKCTLMILMDHWRRLISQSLYNGLSCGKIGIIFGPLIFCTTQAYPVSAAAGINGSAFGPLKPYFSFLDHRMAARLMEVVLQYWPWPKDSADSSTLEYSTVSMTKGGNGSLADLLDDIGSS